VLHRVRVPRIAAAMSVVVMIALVRAVRVPATPIVATAAAVMSDRAAQHHAAAARAMTDLAPRHLVRPLLVQGRRIVVMSVREARVRVRSTRIVVRAVVVMIDAMTVHAQLPLAPAVHGRAEIAMSARVPPLRVRAIPIVVMIDAMIVLREALIARLLGVRAIPGTSAMIVARGRRCAGATTVIRSAILAFPMTSPPRIWIAAC